LDFGVCLPQNFAFFGVFALDFGEPSSCLSDFVLDVVVRRCLCLIFYPKAMKSVMLDVC